MNTLSSALPSQTSTQLQTAGEDTSGKPPSLDGGAFVPLTLAELTAKIAAIWIEGAERIEKLADDSFERGDHTGAAIGFRMAAQCRKWARECEQT